MFVVPVVFYSCQNPSVVMSQKLSRRTVILLNTEVQSITQSPLPHNSSIVISVTVWLIRVLLLL
jgi:hypothetical protein